MTDRKRRWICAGLILLFTVGLGFYGSKREQGEKEKKAVKTETQEEAIGEATEETENTEVAHIVMTYQTLGSQSRTAELEEVVEAVNKIARKEIGVEVELKVSEATDSFTDYPLWISQGEPIDLMILNYQDITGYVKSHMIVPLDTLLDSYGSGIREIMKNGDDLTQGSVYQGKTYGVTNVSGGVGSGGGIWISRQILHSVGIQYEENHIYSIEELDEILGRLKKRYPDSYPLGQITAGATSTTYMYYCENDWNISGSFTTGILKDGRICDFYETEEYYQFLLQLKEWYEKGYIFPDAAFTDEKQAELYQAGLILSKPFSSIPGMADDLMADDLVCLKTTDIWKGERGERAGFWVIPVTSKNQAAAMKFLNLMLTDTRIGNLFSWGIEGKHYVVKEDGTVTYPEGKDIATVGYRNPMGLYGDYSKIYRMQSKEEKEELDKYVRQTRIRKNQYEGFVYDKTNVADKLVKVQEVVQEYIPVLESGSVDLELYYPEFINALNQAGMRDIIEDKQSQFDAYLAEEEMDGDK